MRNIILTGFGPFGDVTENPSQQLVEAVAKEESDGHVRPIATAILEVSAVAALFALLPLYGRLHTEKEPTVLVHLGVNSKATRFHIELCAYNEGTFRIPDVRGWAGAPVLSPGAGPLRTQLPAAALAAALTDRGEPAGQLWELSDDPGRYLCNLVYYASLTYTQHQAATAVFLHVPPLEAVPLARQRAFLAAFLGAVAAL